MTRPVARQRVVVDLGAVAPDPLALRAAVELAGLAGAEFAGLFVEDVNLLRLGSLPFAAEIGLASAAWRPLAAADVERMFRLQAVRLQHALEQAARVIAMEWSFEVARGTPLARLLEARGDVIVVSGTARMLRSLGGPEQALRQAFIGVPKGAGRRGPVAVVVSEMGAASGRALESARALARNRAAETLVIATGGAVGMDVGHARDLRLIRMPDLDPRTLAGKLRGAQALFWPVPADPDTARDIEWLRRLLDCPLVLVR